ncbi:MAG: M28 family peptidase, partial [Planctomycetales bacterium]|nr:M28 family peptidase [Planctomycetales bacterium]
FVNEEQPWFQSEDMGSYVYARRCKERKENIVAMLSLETIGYYSDEKGSQKFDSLPPLRLLYPDTGNFIAFVADVKSGPLAQQVVGKFRETTKFPAYGCAMPENIPGVGWSDQWSFWKMGYSGLMVTDTAPFRYPHYHKKTDTPDKIDFERTARVVAGLERVIADLAGVK